MLEIQSASSEHFVSYSISNYIILLLEEGGDFSIDFIDYTTPGFTVLFLTPYQHLQWKSNASSLTQRIEFHGDYYCIEYHKKEVACNGLLFNNIYLQPHFTLEESTFKEVQSIVNKMEAERKNRQAFTDSVLKSYLQLILAICSREKVQQLDKKLIQQPVSQDVLQFQQLLEQHFISERNTSFYAKELAISLSSLSKKVKQQVGKTPTELIRERVVLEAKKQLHLTYKSVKEIARDLHFDDEHYFSRYFKKEIGLAPTQFREQVGIAMVAK